MAFENDDKLIKKHLEDLDKAQDERLEHMFEELKGCSIENLSLIDSKNPTDKV